ncbi:helix-turn-helix domain-containing protein [Limosilactobacillus albertensis]|uniref:Helix-turn-helix transcriptional regulator n=1 Tax=Limosilactobacillus albertensis TaxID=2759752 RepID=A0A839H7N4_9LACO|nr:helix-turn-helix transcriptional regulator [Limosilactobacillus albertensis]MBB1123206.1 helix-turn-helix transcriptional regulator [Limosilactobacillus albertensis]MCD7122892.1 helix-turn-helix transcriptional regulator [Limosilactobacillus albertensis]
MNNNIIGTNIANRRHALNISQEKLAEASDLSINYISRIERGASKHISAESLYKISKSLNISMESLMERKNTNHINPGPQQEKLINYLQNFNLEKSETLSKHILDLLMNYHIEL